MSECWEGASKSTGQWVFVEKNMNKQVLFRSQTALNVSMKNKNYCLLIKGSECRFLVNEPTFQQLHLSLLPRVLEEELMNGGPS